MPPTASQPAAVIPADGCDAHCHVFGPYDRFPLAPNASYVPPRCAVEDYLRLLETLRLSRGVLVQPSAHGLDNRAMLHAVATTPDRLRGVAVVQPGTSASELATLTRQGVRGLRFCRLMSHGQHRFNNVVDIGAIPDMLPAMRRNGLHVQLWADLELLPALAPTIRLSGVPFVLDHMGRVDPAKGVDDPNFELLCQLLSEGHVWIKLTPYRRSSRFPSYPDLRGFHERLLRVNPEQLVWGSDWPHVSMTENIPDAGRLLDLLAEWTPPALFAKILVDNPARLYGF